MKNVGPLKGIFLTGCLMIMAVACSKNSATGSLESASSAESITESQVKVSMKIYNDVGVEVYNDASPTSLLALGASRTYRVVLSPSRHLGGLTYQMALTKTSAIGSPPQNIVMREGDNSLVVSSQGDYSLRLIAAAPNMLTLTKFYTAAVSCATPSFTANSLNANAISLAASSPDNNLFNVSASGITAGANGQAPYLCAFDPTGTGIINTGFVDCNSGVSNFYSNFVATRRVAVVVKDACNTIYTVSKNINVPFTVPASGANNVFIYAEVSQAAGSAISDSRVDGVTYLATNQNPGHNIVQPMYGGGSTFSIRSSQNYGMSSSVPFGMTISIAGMTGNVNVVQQTGSLSLASATMTLSYSTDQAGDSRSAVVFGNGSCVLSSTGATVVYGAGTPCTSGTGTGKLATVEIWGSYTCSQASNSSGSITISGKFDGMTTLVDSCNTGGSGGVTPINL